MLDWLLNRSRADRRGTASADGEALFDEEFQRRLEYLAIVSRRIFAGRTRAERRSKKTGSGIEFADHRPYVPGDDFRYLDWNVYQRLGRLLLRLYEEEEDLSVYVLVDASRSMAFGRPPKLEYAKKLAASFAYIALANLDRVSVLSFADGMVGRLAPTRGKNRIFTVFDFLRQMQPQGETSLAASTRTFVAQNKRRGVCILLSDLYDPAGFEEGINALRYAKFEPYVLHLLDRDETHPPLHGDVLLVDDETGERREVTVTPRILARFEQAHRGWRQRIETFCRDKQVAYHPLETHIPFDQAVLNVLRRGEMIR
ncbi:MAG: DUF58 domain-containing protein [Myxococcota bacterium]